MPAILFDIDGTLLDSVDLHALAWREAFLAFGKDIPFDVVRSQIGKGGDQLLPMFLSPAELAASGKEIERWRSDWWKLRYQHRVKPFPGVRALFEGTSAPIWFAGGGQLNAIVPYSVSKGGSSRLSMAARHRSRCPLGSRMQPRPSLPRTDLGAVPEPS